MLLRRFGSYPKLAAALARLAREGGIRTVSLDVFDTLVHRRISPALVIDAVCHLLRDRLAARGIDVSHRTLRECRHDAYVELVVQNVASGLDPDTTLDELASPWVARAVGKQLDDGGVAELGIHLVAAEVELEQRVCYPNPWLQALLPELKAAHVRVVCISDMYLGERYVRAILDRCGLLPMIDEVYVSGDVRLLKRTGRLFQHVQRRIQTPRQQWLHVGDNFHADGLMATQNGVRAWIVGDPRMHGQARRLDFDAQTYRNQPAWGGTLVAGYAQPLPSTRFCEEEAFGYRVLGPIFASFVHRLVERCREVGVEHVYFLAREGHLLREIYRCLAPIAFSDHAPPASYLAVSRLTALAATMGTYGIRALGAALANSGHHSVQSLLAPLGLPPSTLAAVALRNGFPDIDLPLPAPACDFPPLLRILDDPEIKDRARQQSEQGCALLHAYLAQQGFFQCQRVALVDLGWGGQIQDSLFASIRSLTKVPTLFGFYLGTNQQAAWRDCAESRIEGLLADFNDPEWSSTAALEFVWALEAASRAPHGTTLGYRRTEDGAVEPIFRPETDPARVAEMVDDGFIACLQAGIIRYVERYAECVAMLRMPASATQPYASMMIERLVRYPNSEEIAWWHSLTNVSDLGTSETKLLGGTAPLASGWDLLFRLRPLAQLSMFHYGIIGRLAGTPGQIVLCAWKGLRRGRSSRPGQNSPPLAVDPPPLASVRRVPPPVPTWELAIDREVEAQREAISRRHAASLLPLQSTVTVREFIAIVGAYRLAKLVAHLLHAVSPDAALPRQDIPSLRTMLQRELHARWNVRARLGLLRSILERWYK